MNPNGFLAIQLSAAAFRSVADDISRSGSSSMSIVGMSRSCAVVAPMNRGYADPPANASSGSTNGTPRNSATGSFVTYPATVFTPWASAGSRRAAAAAPCTATSWM